MKISLTDRVEAVVAVDLTGDPAGVREQGGIIETVANTVNVRTPVTAIPESIQIDISHLEVGESIRVADLPELEGVEYLDDPDSPIVVIHLPALVEEEAAPEDELEEEAADEDEGGAADAEE